jgi:Glycosyltransferase family 87
MRLIRLTPNGSVQVHDVGAGDRRSQAAGPGTSPGAGAGPLSADALFGGRWLSSQRARRTVYVVLAVELALVIGFAIVYRPFDLRIYLWGGHAVWHGLRLYDVEYLKNWFTYPPFAAVVFAPLAQIPAVVTGLIWELGTVAALAWACVITLRLAGYQPQRLVVLAMVAAGFLLEPVYHTLYLGQVNVFLLTLVLIDFSRISRGHAAGIGTGVATAVKLVPGIFIVFFLVTRRWRDAAISAATFLACSGIGYLVDPSASRLYWTKLFYDTSRNSIPYISNQSPYATVTRLFGGVSHVGGWYDVVPVALGILGLAIAATLAKRQDWLGAATVTGVTGLLVSPISWTHHWVWVLPALVLLMRGGKGARIGAACAFLLFVLAPMWFTPYSHLAGDFGFRGVVTLIANSFTIAGLAFIGYLAVRTYFPPSSAVRCGRTPEELDRRAAAAGTDQGQPAQDHRTHPGWARLDGYLRKVPLGASAADGRRNIELGATEGAEVTGGAGLRTAGNGTTAGAFARDRTPAPSVDGGTGPNHTIS